MEKEEAASKLWKTRRYRGPVAETEPAKEGGSELKGNSKTEYHRAWGGSSQVIKGSWRQISHDNYRGH